MSRLLSTAFAVLSLAAVTGFAHAQEGRGGGRANPDVNGDGVISASEFEDAAKTRFQRMDENHDGVIDAGELATLKARMAERANAGRGGGGRGDQLAEMDADGDGQITQDEALAASKALFEKLDTNHDGVLDATEQDAMRQGGRGGAR
jgi:Ca2+-binding EF-hand superfamily protein